MNDPYICLSIVNTVLRDYAQGEMELNEYLIDKYNITINEVKDKLAKIGYHYNEILNQFTNVE